VSEIREKKKCKFCAEEIFLEAQLCRFCGKKQKSSIEKIDEIFEKPEDGRWVDTKVFWGLIWAPTMFLMIIGFILFLPLSVLGLIYWCYMSFRYDR